MSIAIARLYGARDLRLETEVLRQPGEGEVILRMAAGGICGSDLHYYQDGGFGPVRVREPIIPGHEAAGYVEALGAGVSGLTIGQLVALNPSQPCGECVHCLAGNRIHCLSMRFMGSAMRLPHEQGMFRSKMTVPAAQCVPVTGDVSAAEAACAEPLAVCLHAVAKAGSLKGKTVLVTGSGPIGASIVAVARFSGAQKIVVTDLADEALARARAMGADETVNVATHSAALQPYEADKGQFDVAFECSAAAPAIQTAMTLVRPLGIIVQVGVSGNTAIPLNMLVGKEFRFLGTQRFDAEFAQAVDLISRRAIDVRPILTHTFPLADAVAAFEQAGDRTTACKVQLVFQSA
jgi:L-idonate 5-dehydrogenase